MKYWIRTIEAVVPILAFIGAMFIVTWVFPVKVPNKGTCIGIFVSKEQS